MTQLNTAWLLWSAVEALLVPNVLPLTPSVRGASAESGAHSKALNLVNTWLLATSAKVPWALVPFCVTSLTISERPSIPLQRAAAAGTLNQEPYKRLNMALFIWAALSAGISIMRRSLWSAQGLM